MSRESNIPIQLIIKVEKIIIVITGIAVTTIVSMACLMRALFKIDLVGYEEILVMFAFWLYMIGSAYGTYEKSQITADILNIYLKEGILKSTINLIRSFLTLVLAAWFGLWAFGFTMWGIEMHTKTPVWRLPMVWGQSSIFIGLFLITIFNVLYFWDECVLFYESLSQKKSQDNFMKGGKKL